MCIATSREHTQNDNTPAAIQPTIIAINTDGVACLPLHSPQYQRSTAYIGFVAASAYQLAYTVPNWKAHVADHIQAHNVSPAQMVALLVGFGGLSLPSLSRPSHSHTPTLHINHILHPPEHPFPKRHSPGLFNCNAFFQALVFKQEDGALGVSIVTAMRGAVVSFLSGVLFCSPAAPWQCLTFWRGCSAVVVSIGGLLWTLHSPALLNGTQRSDSARPPSAKKSQ
uniref:Uncharacterized protein n=1 Tax=Tetraselmis chuii TaxID=63592 RepID=A0A7S1SY44_9CHLO|mmetsp:Transcript_3586/g.6536  ORF Transcript_3586/g.6536 Transcript_3586/m.6536 type:complete len:225 (+) Transcript_3586:545-1219(+)